MLRSESGEHSEFRDFFFSPDVSYPANATNATVPVPQAQTLTLTNWPPGQFIAEWYDPATTSRSAFLKQL
jgi:hypothetical protein